MGQGISEDVPNAEQASVGTAETADAESMDKDVTRVSRGEGSICAGTLEIVQADSKVQYTSSSNKLCLAVKMDMLLVISSLPWAGKPFV